MPPELDYTTMTSDIIIDGVLRKAKNWNKRYFVLRNSYPAKLEYYESERKWKTNGKPKRTINLERPWNIAKKKGAKHQFLIVIFTEEECFSVAAENAEEQDRWMKALQRVTNQDSGCLFYKHMWLATLENKDLDGYNSSVTASLHGPHLVCLTTDQMILVQANCNGGADRSRSDVVEIPITSIRGIAHNKEGKFYVEPGRASGIGSGRLWMELGDEVMAASMHQTILRLMYDLKEEEAYNYRSRSYSSGSNAGRVRSVRSHHNNPPPSLVGMGKVTGAISKRMRCDSMPATHVSGLNNSRLRTGSEGEHTMRRPRNNSVRCHNGSSSPGMRSRLLKNNGRRSSFLHPHPHHQHSSHALQKQNFSCGCSTPSNDSSSEHLNNIVGYTDFSSLFDSAALEDFLNNHSPVQSNPHGSQRIKPIIRPTNPYQENWASSIREGHHCSCCSVLGSQLSFDEVNRIPIRHEMAPPPPEIDPPHNPFYHSSVNHDYINYCVTSRTNSVVESENCSTPTSSLSSSPRESSVLQAPDSSVDCLPSSSQKSTEEDAIEQTTSTPPSVSPKSQSPSPLVDEPSSNLPDEYIPMNPDGAPCYPHQIMPASLQKPTNSSFLSKVASFAGLSHSRSSSSGGDPEYTPMARTVTDCKPQSVSTTVEGYVPMKSFVKSVSQDIGSRRRSMPDTSHRNSFNRAGMHRSSPPLTDEFCQDCYERARRQYVAVRQPTATYASAKTCRNCVAAPQGDSEKSVGVNSGHLAPPISDTSRFSTPSPTTKEDLLNMQLLHHEICCVDASLHNSKSDLNEVNPSSASIMHDSHNDINRYLPMNAIHPAFSGHARKGVYNSIISVTENHHQLPVGALYPHQRKDRTFVTNSLERPKPTRSKRTKSLTSLRRTASFARRSQSVKDRSVNEGSFETGSSSSISSSASRCPGGDYVNIDFRKAQEQYNCPRVVNVAAP